VKIAALLCWFDEPVEMLDRCVRSLSGVADEVLAVDGRWELFPGEEWRSPLEQRDAILDAARDVDLVAFVAQPSEAYESQMVKRAIMFNFARFRRADWALIMDADNHVVDCDGEALRAVLAATDRDVASSVVEGVRNGRSYRTAVRRFYRMVPGLTVDRAHNGYRTGDGRWLLGDHAYVSLEPALDLRELLTIAHDDSPRSERRDAARREYRASRQLARVEAWA
jgi:hypothetical protein